MEHPAQNGSSYISIVGVLLLAITGLTWGLSFFVPIYIDDLQYAIMSSRAGFDGWRIISTLPLCSHSFGTPIPQTLLPGRTLAWLVYYPISTPVAMRLFGMLTLAGWMGLLTWMSSICFNVSRRKTITLVISLSFLGILPFMGTLMRPETPLAIVVTFFALLPFLLKQAGIGRTHSAIFAIGILMLSSWFFSAHPKTIFFFPLAIYAMWRLQISMPWRVASICLLLCIIFQGYQYSAYRLTCPDSALAQQFIANSVLQPGILLTKPDEFVHKFMAGVTASTYYFNSILFAPTYGSGWLPPGAVTALHGFINRLIGGTVVCIMLFWVYSASLITVSAWKNKTWLQPDFVSPFLLLSCVGLTAGFQQSKNFYDVTLIWFSGVCLTVILIMRTPSLFPRWIRTSAYIGLLTVSILSQVTLLYTFWKLPDVNQRADINGSLQSQPMSASMLHYDAIHERIVRFSAQCHIDPKQTNSHLLLDMFTYLPFKESYRPVFVRHLENQVIPFARQHHSTGMITLCSSLPKNVQDISVKDNGLCCMSRSAISSIP